LYKKVEGDWVAVGAELSGGSLFEWSNLLPGEYKIVETTVPVLYEGGDDVLFIIDADGDTLIGEDIVEGEVLVVNDPVDCHITINKVDINDTPLEGAGFTLYEYVDGDWVAVGSEKTGQTSYYFGDLWPGEFKIVETTVPDGYVKADDVLFLIDETGSTWVDDIETDNVKVFNDKEIIITTTPPEGPPTTPPVTDPPTSDPPITDIPTTSPPEGPPELVKTGETPIWIIMAIGLMMAAGGALILAAGRKRGKQAE
jgi:LPXTG-motif cell wall-anchored protein